MKNFTTVLKIAPAFLLASTMIHAQTDSTTKEKKIEEVVLIGYGKQKKSDLTGSITSISSKDFNAGATSPDQLIQGKTPGVQITGNSGAPGAGSTIRLRGGSSFQNNDPLIVIDGVPMDFTGVSGAANALALINPNDIETFDILKDASSAAIYGNRASNGVILITTKKGSSGKLKVNFSSTASVSTKMGTVDVLDADQFRSFVNQYAPDSYKEKLGAANTNWQDLIYQQAWGTDNNIALSGGVKNLPYRLSLGYNQQNGLVRTSEFKRTSLGLNLSPKFFDKHLSIEIGFKGSFSENRFPDTGAIRNAMNFDPTQPVYSETDAAGNPVDTRFGGYWEWLNSTDNNLNVNGTKNPISMLYGKRDISSVWRLIPSLQLDYKFHFLPELRWNVNVAYDYAKGEGSNTVNSNTAIGYFTEGSYRAYTQENSSKLFETYLNYVKKINAINTNVDVMVGHSYQDTMSKTPAAPTFFGNGTVNSSVNSENQRTLLSFYGRAIFTIADKYIITASLRRDGSSTFYNGTTDNLWGNFPAVALAWKINEESFMKGITSISTLKLRAGWGKTGQQETGGYYPAFARYTTSSNVAQYQFGNQFYNLLRPEVYNPNLVWETMVTRNIGLDFGFLNNRINGSIDYFEKKSEDLIAKVPTWAGDLSNFNVKNIGTMNNKGIEVNLNLVPIKKENFTWDVNFNFTKFDPIVESLSDQVEEGYIIRTGTIDGPDRTIQANTVGLPMNSFYVFQQVYDQNGKPIDGVYVDRNGDGIINDSDKYFYKSATPDAILGFSTKLQYHNWDFGFSLRAVLGNYVYNNAASNGSLQNVANLDFLSNVHSSVLDYQFSKPEVYSDIFVENASFLRMDNINVGYNFGQVFGKSTSLRVNAMAQNVFVITKYTGVDPEIFGNIDNGFYQRPKIYSLGFNFQF